MTRFIDRLINRWIICYTDNLIKEAKELKINGFHVESRVIVAIASALNKTNGKI